MALLVVPLAAAETGDLTIREWAALLACDLVVFEDPEHPLIRLLEEAGVKAGPFDDEPAADRDGWALVAAPGSKRIVELAKDGATVTSGSAAAPDALTAAHGSYIGRRAARDLGSLALVMARLRSPDGCPWDAEQTHETLETHLLEEANEVLQTIDAGEVGAELADELGDLLLQVLFHSQLAADDRRFDVSDVAQGIVAKLIRRHPHVFGDVQVEGADEVLRNWQEIKKDEPARSHPFDENALERAVDRLLALARRKGVDPEAALARAAARFRESA